jgi:hypothetical protein
VFLGSGFRRMRLFGFSKLLLLFSDFRFCGSCRALFHATLSGGGVSLSAGFAFRSGFSFNGSALLRRSICFTTSSSLARGSFTCSGTSARNKDTYTPLVSRPQAADRKERETLTPLRLSRNVLVQIQANFVLLGLKLQLAERLGDDKGPSLGTEPAHFGRRDVLALESRSRGVENVVDLGEGETLALGHAQGDRVRGCFEEFKACWRDAVGGCVFSHCDFVGGVVLELEFEGSDGLLGFVSLSIGVDLTR